MNEYVHEALDVMSKAVTAEFSTINSGGYPVTRAMLNLRNAKNFPGLSPFMSGTSDVYLTTNTFLPKVNEIISMPKCSAYYFLPDEFRGVLLYGNAEIVQDQKTKESIWQKGWEMYYPGGVADPDYTVIKICPAAVKGYKQLTHYSIDGTQWQKQ